MIRKDYEAIVKLYKINRN